nr:unnamed protein product [Digitaria exilis]
MGRKAKRVATKKGSRDAEKAAAPPADDSASSDGEERDTAGTTLPMANLVRLMRQVIPKGIKVATSAKHLTHDCAVEFVGFVASEASEHAKVQHRRIIAPEDFTCAFQSLGLDDYVQPMSTYIRRYREQHNAYGRVVVTRPPSDAAAMATVTASGVPCSSCQEMQHMSWSMVPPLCGEHVSNTLPSEPMASGFLPPGGATNGGSNGGGGGAQAAQQQQQQAAPMIREQDRLMPIANVIRIMRRVLPPHAKISDDAKETIQECVSEYISFITGEANERCQREQRKTITAEDVLWAMSRLGFDDYVEPLSVYLHRYREFEGEARGVVGLPPGGSARGGAGDHHHHPMAPPPVKSRPPGAAMAPHHHDMQLHASMYGGPPPPHHGFVMPHHHHQGGQYLPYHYEHPYGGEHHHAAMAAYYGGGAAYAPGSGEGSGGSGGSASHTATTQGGSFENPFASYNK